MKISTIHKISLLLDPKKRSLKMFEDDEERKDIKQLLLNEMKLYDQIETIEPPLKRLKTILTSIQLSDQFNDESEEEDSISNTREEYEQYFNSKFNSEETENLLKFWYLNSKKFPILYKIALKYLCVPATEFESERNFSTVGRVCESRRSNLSHQNIDYIVFIKII